MNQDSLFKPTPELMQEWLTKWKAKRATVPYDEFFATEAARWGADQQLEQDAKWLDTNALFSHNLTISPSGDALRQEMRPKPPSLKEQALQALATANGADHPVVATVLTADQHALLRKALEQLDD